MKSIKQIINVLKKMHAKQIDALTTPSLPKDFILKSVNDAGIDTHIASYFYPKSPITEQYKRLREHIKSASKHEKIQTLAITSSVHNEGKSLTALNLAVVMAQDVDCESVVLVDCDLRKGMLDKHLGISAKAGLSEYLYLGAEMENIIFKTKIGKLSLIPRGKIMENPAELLGSEKMKNFIKKLKDEFAVVIFDTPPVVPVADACIVGSKVDGVAMVVRAGKTQRGIVKHAKELLEQSKVNLIGSILTHVEYYIPAYIYRYV